MSEGVSVVDANVLLYAVDRSAPWHAEAKAWLDRALSGSGTIVFPWVCRLAFLRISTHSGIFPNPLKIEQALDVIEAWLSRPNVVVPGPGRAHLDSLRSSLAETGSGDNLVNDAHIAAIARDADAVVVTFDADFGRFPGVRWQRPERP